jgi:hypothetical protein
MADQPQAANKSKTDSEKKQPETVILTAEELRAIAGGAGSTTGTSPGSPTTNPKGMGG